jgi:5-methylcytosine-specific restriction endonuclease McrA
MNLKGGEVYLTRIKELRGTEWPDSKIAAEIGIKRHQVSYLREKFGIASRKLKGKSLEYALAKECSLERKAMSRRTRGNQNTKGHHWQNPYQSRKMSLGIGRHQERYNSWEYEWARDYALGRDKYTCQSCGKKQGDGVKIGVHHIVPIRHGGKNDKDNLITFCQSCHSRCDGLLIHKETNGVKDNRSVVTNQ